MSQHQIERLRPAQLDAERDRCPVAYIPLGATEFHGRHLPVGLDTLKCHQVLIRCAETHGGLVTPPVFFGHGGGHTEFDWTWMLSKATMIDITLSVLKGLDRNGIKVIVLMSGHYPNRAFFDQVIETFEKDGGKAKVLPIMEFDAFDDSVERHGDHASKWETSYMLALHEELVDMNIIQRSPEHKIPEANYGNGWWFEKDESHPWFGIAAAEGNTPDKASKEIGEAAVKQVVEYVGDKVKESLKGTP